MDLRIVNIQSAIQVCYYLARMRKGQSDPGCVRLSVSTKIARSEDLGILMIGKRDHIIGSGEKLSFSAS